MDKQHCIGCRDNFYNGNNDIGVAECWALRQAKLVTKWCIGWNVPTYQENFEKCRVPNCMTQPGRVYYTDSIKDFPKHRG